MKRPLVVLAAGYVLGEVLALQDNTAVDLGGSGVAVCSCGGNSMAFGYMEGSTAPFCSKREDAGQKQPETQGASALLVCLLSGSSLGMARGWQEKGILDHEESVARTMAGARILVRGVIKKRNKRKIRLHLCWRR